MRLCIFGLKSIQQLVETLTILWFSDVFFPKKSFKNIWKSNLNQYVCLYHWEIYNFIIIIIITIIIAFCVFIIIYFCT